MSTYRFANVVVNFLDMLHMYVRQSVYVVQRVKHAKHGDMGADGKMHIYIGAHTTYSTPFHTPAHFVLFYLRGNSYSGPDISSVKAQ